MQTLISDHVIAYGPWGASLLWFDAELAPHVLRPRSAVEPVVGRAKWAVGAHELQLQNGQVLWDGDSTADARTAIGINWHSSRRIAWGWPSRGYLHRRAGAAMPQAGEYSVLRLNGVEL
jgi:hypothetical protein